jgi:hypothetical protein
LAPKIRRLNPQAPNAALNLSRRIIKTGLPPSNAARNKAANLNTLSEYSEAQILRRKVTKKTEEKI